MSNQDSSKPKGYIRIEDREPELEDLVYRFIKLLPEQKRNDILYKRVEIPTFTDEVEEEDYYASEYDRCINGYNGLSGRMYFYFNYCFIQNIKGGRIAPEYRVSDQLFFDLYDDCLASEEFGIICVKRRRAGFSWKAAAIALYDAIFRPFSVIGMMSKTEEDGILLFRKVKFMYDNLPSFLRPSTQAGNTQSSIEFAYIERDENDNRKKQGTQSLINVVAPVATAFEGQMLTTMIIDESGKIKTDLSLIWSLSQDCLMQETVRVGVPVIFGTAGDIDKEGRGLFDMWYNAEVHKLKRFFFNGAMGIMCDEYGNDRIEDAVRWIVYERRRLERLSKKEYNNFVQKYPLTIEEAFSQISDGGVGDTVIINSQINNLKLSPPKAARGYFQEKGDKIIFIPSNNGDIIMYEPVEEGAKNLYTAGCDPIDHDIEKKTSDISDACMYIMKKADGTSPPYIVMEYCSRPILASDYYEQALLALRYYNNCKVLIERNRYRMISYFDENGYRYLLKSPPQLNKQAITNGSTIGIYMNENTKAYLCTLIEEYVDSYSEYILSIELLQEFIAFGTKNTDRAMSFGITLISLKDDRATVKKNGHINSNIPTFGYAKINGKIQRK